MTEFRVKYRLMHVRVNNDGFSSFDTDDAKQIKEHLNRFKSANKEDKNLIHIGNGYYWEEFLERVG